MCRGDDKFLYLKGGIFRRFNDWGPTAIYGEHYWGWKSQNESDTAALRALELNLNAAQELSGSTMTMWGLGVVQTIKPKGPNEMTTDLYIGYRNYRQQVDLIGGGGGGVASKDLKDFSAVMAGIRLRWGENDND